MPDKLKIEAAADTHALKSNGWVDSNHMLAWTSFVTGALSNEAKTYWKEYFEAEAQVEPGNTELSNLSLSDLIALYKLCIGHHILLDEAIEKINPKDVREELISQLKALASKP